LGNIWSSGAEEKEEDSRRDRESKLDISHSLKVTIQILNIFIRIRILGTALRIMDREPDLASASELRFFSLLFMYLRRYR
jgi:hypothetical protein